MKSIALNAVLAASAAQAYILPPRTHKIDWKLEQKRQIIGAMTTMLGKGGKVADPPGASSKRVNLQTTSKVSGVKRIKLRYGPYSVPNMNKTSITGEAGMLWNFPDLAIPKPCTTCTIVSQVAGLEYPDGKNANIDTGMWLHHMVHFAIGTGRWDPTCVGKPSLPHIDVNATPQNAERYFSSGNERTHVQLDVLGATGTKFGYHIKSTDKFGFIVDLMNMNMQDKTVYMTMTYDIIDGPLPAGWRDVKVVWFDAAQCGTSEVRPPKQSGSFTISSGKWKPNFEGDILGTGGHVHDGGVKITVNYQQGKQLCTSNAGYAEKNEYVSGGHTMGGVQSKPGSHAHGVASKHISSMTQCYLSPTGELTKEGSWTGLPIKSLSPDQSWYVSALYDYDKFEGNKNGKGSQDEIMAIALMYVAISPSGVKPPGGGSAPSGGKAPGGGMGGGKAPGGGMGGGKAPGGGMGGGKGPGMGAKGPSPKGPAESKSDSRYVRGNDRRIEIDPELEPIFDLNPPADF